MTLIEIIEYLKHKSQLENPSPNKFKEPAKQFLLKFANEHNINSNDLKILFYLFVHDLKEIPLCQFPDCNNFVRFTTFNAGFSKGCSHLHAKQISNLNLFGCKSPFESKLIQDKIKKTYEEKYGNENPFKTKQYQDKIIEKYGVEHPMKSDFIKNKLKTVMKQKYGGIGNQAESIKKKCVQTQKNKYLNKLDNDNYPAIRLFADVEFVGVHGWHTIYPWQCKKCNTKFTATITDGMLPRCPICFPKLSSGISNMETELFESINIENKIRSDKSILGNLELDIYIPDKQLAIEFNGLYWHSELNGKDKFYHLNKTKKCEEKGIQLIHIFEHEWKEKKNIILSLINAKLGLFEKIIDIDECTIKNISTTDKTDFLTINNITGDDNSSIKIGLFHNEELISVMTFSKSKDKNYQYELNNFGTKLNYNIPNNTLKLFDFFKKEYNPKSIVTYLDKRYFCKSFFNKLDFNLVKETPPLYWYFNNSIKGVNHKSKWTKNILKNKLKIFDSQLTEWENMQLNGYDRIWDCGYNVLEWQEI